MLRLTVAVLALALAGAASAGGWRSLRVDASSGEAFVKSLEAFGEKLPSARRFVFHQALQDIWIEGSKAAAAEQRDYTDADYLRQIDGLSYEQIVTLTDPTGETARDRYRTASFDRDRKFAGAPASGDAYPLVRNGVHRGYTTGVWIDYSRLGRPNF